MKRDKDIWSFSRLTSYDNCAYNFYKTYILKEKGDDNFFSQLGTALHELCERVANGEIDCNESNELFHDNFYDFYTEAAPPHFIDLELSAYEKMSPYFSRSKYWKGNVLSAEKYVEYQLPSNEWMRGYIDLVIENKDGVDLIDFKSSTPYKGKNLESKRMQLDLYAWAWKQETGEYPKRLIFSWFKDCNNPTILPFDYDKMMRAVEFADSRIEHLNKLLKVQDKLNAVGLFMPDRDKLTDKKGNRDFFCKNLCNHKSSCIFTQEDKFNMNKFDLNNIE